MSNWPRLIGVTGYAQSGKDTTGSILRQLYEYERVAFADPLRNLLLEVNPEVEGRRLKEIIEEIGWDEAKVKYPIVREMLQGLGVGARDIIHPEVWVDAAFKKVAETGRPVVITDVRFPNEYHRVHGMEGKIVRVQRPGVTAVNAHESETALDGFLPDYVLHNDGEVRDLADEVMEMMNYFAKKASVPA
jgi:hypothetical protein